MDKMLATMDNFEFPKVNKLLRGSFPLLLREMPGTPDKLYICGDSSVLHLQGYKYLCIVGSRRYTEYGRRVCEWLIEGLRGTSTVIISGLAMGIDTVAHKSAMANSIKTIAVPGSGLNPDILYPRINTYVAEDILKSGGCLVSPFEPDRGAANWTFPVRNQIMAGMSHATLIIEGEEDSGTLITAKLAADYNRDVFVVPGSIFSEHSKGPHRLLRDGATPITSQKDLLEALGFKVDESVKDAYENCSEEELKIVSILSSGALHKDQIIEQSKLTVSKVHILISILETKNLVEQKFGKVSLRFPYNFAKRDKPV